MNYKQANQCPEEFLAELEDLWLSAEEQKSVEELLGRVFQAGADAELDACCEWLSGGGYAGTGPALMKARMAARRPRLSLKQQALADLEEIGSHYIGPGTAERLASIRSALEALSDD
jgi:hypothetical protein